MNEKQNGLSEKADAAFREATTVVIQRAKQTGTPVVVWEDGHIKEIPTDQFDTPTTQQGDKSAM